MNKNIMRVVALVIVAIMLMGTFASIFMYASSTNLDQGVYAYGAGLTESEIADTAKLLEMEDGYTSVKITGADTLKYINEDNPDNILFSSVYAKKNNDNVVTVDVMTPLMIKEVTGLQYSNAAITAGLESVDIRVASVKPVTGTSALTGVYKIMELAGVQVDPEKTKAANDEIQVINVIAEEHKDKEEFSKEKLNQAVLEIKQELIDKKEENGTVTAEEVGTVIQTVIKDNKLDQVINDVDIQNLQVMFQNFINIENLNISVVKEQLNNLAKDAPQIAEKEFNRVKDFLNSSEGKAFLDSISDKLSKENLEKALDSAKNSLDTPEVESVIDSIKDTVNSENAQSVIEKSKEALGIDEATSNSISNFFSSIFKAIGNFFKSLFN